MKVRDNYSYSDSTRYYFKTKSSSSLSLKYVQKSGMIKINEGLSER